MFHSVCLWNLLAVSGWRLFLRQIWWFPIKKKERKKNVSSRCSSTLSPQSYFLTKHLLFFIIFTGFELHIDNLIIILLNPKMYWKCLLGTSKSISVTVLRKWVQCSLLIKFSPSQHTCQAMHSRGRHNIHETCHLQFAELLHSHAQCSNLKNTRDLSGISKLTSKNQILVVTVACIGT